MAEIDIETAKRLLRGDCDSLAAEQRAALDRFLAQPMTRETWLDLLNDDDALRGAVGRLRELRAGDDDALNYKAIGEHLLSRRLGTPSTFVNFMKGSQRLKTEARQRVAEWLIEHGAARVRSGGDAAGLLAGALEAFLTVSRQRLDGQAARYVGDYTLFTPSMLMPGCVVRGRISMRLADPGAHRLVVEELHRYKGGADALRINEQREVFDGVAVEKRDVLTIVSSQREGPRGRGPLRMMMFHSVLPQSGPAMSLIGVAVAPEGRQVVARPAFLDRFDGSAAELDEKLDIIDAHRVPEVVRARLAAVSQVAGTYRF